MEYFKRFSKSDTASAGTRVTVENEKIGDREDAQNVLEVMREDNIDLGSNTHTTLTPDMLNDFDKVIVMAEPDRTPEWLSNSPKFEYWDIPNVNGMPLEQLRRVRDDIKSKVRILARQKNVLIIITGMPGTGKTTLGRTLSKKYRFPFISKDALKDRMFDTLGWKDKAWSLQISGASHRIMDYIITEELQAGHSIIVESNFKHEIDSERFKKIQAAYGCSVLQILCWADGETVFKRFMNRIGTAERHAGHVEKISPEEIRRGFVAANGKDKPLDVDGATIELDTTDLEKIDYTAIFEAVQAQAGTAASL